MAWRKINNLYPARCAGCRAKVERGVSVWYDRFGRRGHRVRCLECGAGEGGSGAAPVEEVEVPAVPSGRDLVLGARGRSVGVGDVQSQTGRGCAYRDEGHRVHVVASAVGVAASVWALVGSGARV